MYRFQKDGVSVLTIIDRRRPKNNGLYPVKIEVVYKRRQKYYPTGQDVTFQEWENIWKRRKSNDKLVGIERNFHRVRMAVEFLTEKGRFCFSALDMKMGNASMTVNEAITQKMTRLYAEGRVNTYYRYRSTLRALEKYKGKFIHFDDISITWLRRCEATWIREGKSSTTINIYMNTLRCVCREASEIGLMHDDIWPFRRDGYRIPAGRKRTLALTKEQIARIVNWRGDDDLCYWRDMWLFSYLCNGINFRDMLFLKYGDIADGEISFIRSKTSSSSGHKVIKAVVTSRMEEIMERWGNGRYGPCERLIFKCAKGNETSFEMATVTRMAIISCNKALKVIAEDLGIPRFTTYSARHSFATVLKRSGVDIQFISESLGHASIRMTENYLAGFDKEERWKNIKILTDFS